jgi:hypothetical protein
LLTFKPFSHKAFISNLFHQVCYATITKIRIDLKVSIIKKKIDMTWIVEKIDYRYIGDLNYDFLDEKKCAPLVSVCDILDLTNLVKRPTCFTKIADPTLNDVILTNSPNNCMNVLNFNCGISDVHNLISVQIKGNINPAKKSFKTYRSFKNFLKKIL